MDVRLAARFQSNVEDSAKPDALYQAFLDSLPNNPNGTRNVRDAVPVGLNVSNTQHRRRS
jgi:hypothetical protein